MSDPVETGTLIPYLTEMFRFQAWMAMGKVANPVSGEVERDLRMARQMIDLLGELETRTAGNRSNGETRMLQGALTELRLNYLDEMKKPDPEPDPGKAEPAANESKAGGPTDATEAASPEAAAGERSKESKGTE
jgi:hypothetical protein